MDYTFKAISGQTRFGPVPFAPSAVTNGGDASTYTFDGSYVTISSPAISAGELVVISVDIPDSMGPTLASIDAKIDDLAEVVDTIDTNTAP